MAIKKNDTGGTQIVDNRHFGGTPVGGTWVSGVLFVNPLANTVLVDSGGLTFGKYIISLFMTFIGSGNIQLTFQRRNSSNTATVQSFNIMVGPNQTVEFSPKVRFLILTSERFRVINPVAITGQVQCSLFLSRTVFR